MDVIACAWYWLFVAFGTGALVMWCALTGSLPQPELTQRELFCVIKRIAAVYDGDDESMIAMLDELQRWVSWEEGGGLYSKELIKIIREVKNRDYKNR